MADPATIRLSASHTLTLGDSVDRALRVDQGAVELFLVWDSAVMQGRRHHFATLPQGAWIFDYGFGFSDHGVSVLAVGQAETIVSALDPAAAPVATVAAQLDAWLAHVESGLTEVLPAEIRRTHQFDSGETPELTANQVASSRDVPLWWQVTAPGALFYGVKELDVEFTPLTPSGWVVCPQGAPAARAFTSAELLARPDALEEVARAHDLFLRTIQAGVVARGESELLSRERRTQLRAAAGDAAWGDIAGVLAGEQDIAPTTVASSSLQSIVAAFECVARARGIQPQIPLDLQRDGQSKDVHGTLAALVRKTSIRMRHVVLEGPWSSRDNGPLIGFLAEGGEAVALLPQKGRTILQKADGSRSVVDPATPLVPFAYTLYRSLPDRKLTFRDLVKFSTWGNFPDSRIVFAMVILTGLLGLVTPMLTARIFDLVIPQAERLLMVQIGVALIGAAIVKAMLELVRGISMLRIQNRTDLHLQAAVWDRLLKMPTRFFRQYTAGDLATRAQGITQMHDIMSSAGTAVLFALPVGLFNFIVMFHRSHVLAFWGLGLAVLALVVTFTLNARQVMLLREQLAIQGRIAGLVFQLINGIPKFRIAGGEHLAFATWAKDYARQERISVQAGRWAVGSHAFFSGFSLFTSVVIFAVVASLAGKEDGFTTGSFLAFNSAFGALVGALISVGEKSLDLLRIFPLLERTRPIFDAEPEIADDRAHPGPLTGDIEIANITFRYAPDIPPVLDDFSLRIKPGEFVALVGPSGSGKSTILRLLLGFEIPENGTVFYDRKDLHTLDLREVRRQVGVVLQASSLIPGDIFRNIVGESTLTLDDAWRAAEMAGLADDIRAMPMQMHTVISEGGGGFSGGQRQRLAIARALARAPRLLFFDEATSALDNRTQATVTASLEKLKATRVVIAHRLSTIIQADRIVVIKDGRVHEEGKYADLMAQKGFFHELASRQLSGLDDPA